MLSTWRSGLHAITGDSRKAVTALSRFPSLAGVIDTELIVISIIMVGGMTHSRFGMLDPLGIFQQPFTYQRGATSLQLRFIN